MEILQRRLNRTQEFSDIFEPQIFRLSEPADASLIAELLASRADIEVHDEIIGQLRELVKSLNPSRKMTGDLYEELISAHLQGRSPDTYGVWVYYPWNRKLVHLLDESEFVEVRTNRNRYKITRQEQEQLRKAKVGIVGLSVGQSIALTLAMERTCGELRLADFDTVELSNLNRIRTGVHNLGINKTIIAAREIAEIDPFIKVRVFTGGLTKQNLDEFFSADGRLDMLVEVCDGLDIKIVSRFKAKELGIPVIMDTNDRGMLDVERFDLEGERPILHGLAEGLDPENIRDLSNEEKIPYILRMVGADKISTRLKASMIEVEQTLNTWPQLASSVVLGGAVTTDVCRRILLDQFHDSGRYYIDIDKLVGDKTGPEKEPIPPGYLPPDPLSNADLITIADSIDHSPPSVEPGQEEIRQLIDAAVKAPSGGNSQPWKFLLRHSRLYVFHDPSVSWSFLDFRNLGSNIALGAAIENLCIAGAALGLRCIVDDDLFGSNPPLVSVIRFARDNSLQRHPLHETIGLRLTNRNLAERSPLPQDFFDLLKQSVSDYEGAALDIVSDPDSMLELGDILATTEKLVLIHPRGHFDAFQKELRWTEEENKEKRDGVDVATLGISKGEVAALRIANDGDAIAFVRETIRGGDAFKKMAHKAVAASSALGVVSMPFFDEKQFLYGGRAVERVWLEANARQVSVQPITQFTFLLSRLVYGGGEGFDDFYKQQFRQLRDRFFQLLPHLENRVPVFIFRLCKAEEPKIKALRKPIDSVFIY